METASRELAERGTKDAHRQQHPVREATKSHLYLWVASDLEVSQEGDTAVQRSRHALLLVSSVKKMLHEAQ